MLAAELATILAEQRLQALFQPIVCGSKGSIYGYEALIRGPSNSPLHSPLTLFDTANRCGCLAQLDLLCRRIAVDRFVRLELPGQLFLNVTPAVVMESEFRGGETLRFLVDAGLAPERIVIELTEQYPVQDYTAMRAAVEHYREMGFAIAIDDLGAGYSSLRLWSELRPDFVKVDRHFVQGVDQDAGKREFIRSILGIAGELGARVVMEGIETEDEYRCLWSMGLELGQGYHFARPSSLPPRHLDNLLPPARRGERGGNRAAQRETAATLARPLPAVAPHTTTEQVAALFEQDPQLRTLAIVDDGVPLACIRRDELASTFANLYGRSLYSKRPILNLAKQTPLVAAHDTPLETLSQRLTASDGADEQSFIVVDDGGRYLGIGTTLDLLRRITELQIRNARYANPLTGLPGNVPIDEHIAGLLAEGTGFAVAICDIDHFKAFNDHYGHRRGDDVIAGLAQLLDDQTASGDFLGHIGGDDFILVFRGDDWTERCERVLSAFADLAPWFYSADQRSAGGIHGTDRQGRTCFFPIMSLSIGVLPVTPGEHDSPHAIAAVLSELKAQAKRRNGNSLFIERRRYPSDATASEAADGSRRGLQPEPTLPS